MKTSQTIACIPIMGQRKSRPIFDIRDINICTTNVCINVYSPAAQQSAGTRICVEEGVFAVMDSDKKIDINTEWVNTLSEWGVRLLEINENLDEKLFEEWLQEKLNTPSKQFSCVVTAIEE